jgi:hypothetical protein
MNRRKFLAALGTAAAGTSAAVSTGAFTSVSADRSVSVEVADDADALLAMTPSNGPNGEYAAADGGTIALDFTDTDAGGTGVGTDSTYHFDDVFRITNQGTQSSGPLPTAPGDWLSDTCTVQSWRTRRTTDSGDC